jgi:hypothetical protein
MSSQQSNPATLREALRWYAGEIDSLPCEDVEHADDGNAWNSNKDVPSIPNIIFDQGKRAKAALAASGTEAAPTSRKTCNVVTYVSDTHTGLRCTRGLPRAMC